MHVNPLIWALTQGERLLALRIINETSDYNINRCMPGVERTTFGIVVKHGSVRLARHLLRERAADVGVKDATGSLPFHIACERGGEGIVELLLEAGADVTAPRSNGDVPFIIAITYGHFKVVSLLLRHGPPPSRVEASSYLVRACRSGFDDIARELLPWSNLDAEDSASYTALVVAATNGYIDTVRIMLDAMAITNQLNSQSLADALLGAIQGYNADVADLVISRGANVNGLYHKNRTPLMFAAFHGGPTVVEIMTRRPKNINSINDFGHTALHFAALRNNTEAVELILRDADPNIKDHQGNTPLWVAAKRGNEAAVSLILQHESTHIDCANENGSTPLIIAASVGHSAVVRLLICKGAHTQLRTKRGDAALDLARRNGHRDIITILEDPVLQPGIEIMTLSEPGYPLRSSWPIKSVRFLGHFYYGNSFKDYPQIWGYRMTDIGTDWFAPCLRRPRRFLAFLQSWLVFGLATEVLRVALKGDPLSANDEAIPTRFGRRECSEIDLRSLVTEGILESFLPEKYWREWRLEAGMTSLPESECRNRANDIKDMLKSAQGVCERLNVMSRNAEWPLSGEDWTSNILFFSMFGQYITNLASDVYSANRQDKLGARWPEWRLTTALERAMVSNGWCPASIKSISSITCVDTLFIIAQDQLTKDHSSCPANRCTANDISNDAEYKLRHVGDVYCCALVERSDTIVADILSRDEIPVISLHVAEELSSRTEGGKVHVISASVKGTDRLVNYIAISHVWSDGLGNPFENKIHYCQLLRIIRLCRMQDPHARAFWLDTLCVPLDPRLRKVAIRSMGKVYSQASSVVVLDRALMSIQQPPILTLVDEQAREEFALRSLARITISDWTRRLWTLQESINAKAISFALGDLLIKLKWLLQYLERPHAHRHSSIESDCRQIAGFFTQELNLQPAMNRGLINHWKENESLP